MKGMLIPFRICVRCNPAASAAAAANLARNNPPLFGFPPVRFTCAVNYAAAGTLPYTKAFGASSPQVQA